MNHRRVLVVSDDGELGRILALSLLQRDFLVSQVDFETALADGWRPGPDPIDLVIVDIEASERVARDQLTALLERPWMAGLPLVLAAEERAVAAAQLPARTAFVSRPADIGAIVAAARSVLGKIVLL